VATHITLIIFLIEKCNKTPMPPTNNLSKIIKVSTIVRDGGIIFN
jgi:hypothetical protein